ncbi:YlcG family protein [Enterobacter mori]
MKPETIEILRARWQRLRIYRRPGSVLVDYRILRNFVRIYHPVGVAQ